MSIEEVCLNPHFRWNKRKKKSLVLSRVKKLPLHSFALGCRGHVGIVTTKNFSRSDYLGSDVGISSLLDGSEEWCGFFHCAPDPITREFAMWAARPFNHEADGFSNWLHWFKAFNDFDEHYTVEHFDADKILVGKILPKLTELVEKNEDVAILSVLQTAYNTMMRGDDFGVPVLFTGKKFRKSTRREDFAARAEIDSVKETGEKNHADRYRYESLWDRVKKENE